MAKNLNCKIASFFYIFIFGFYWIRGWISRQECLPLGGVHNIDTNMTKRTCKVKGGQWSRAWRKRKIFTNSNRLAVARFLAEDQSLALLVWYEEGKLVATQK